MAKQIFRASSILFTVSNPTIPIIFELPWRSIFKVDSPIPLALVNTDRHTKCVLVCWSKLTRHLKQIDLAKKLDQPKLKLLLLARWTRPWPVEHQITKAHAGRRLPHDKEVPCHVEMLEGPCHTKMRWSTSMYTIMPTRIGVVAEPKGRLSQIRLQSTKSRIYKL